MADAVVSCQSPLLHSLGACGCQLAPFNIVAADPAWLFSDALPGAKRGASSNYQCLTVDELCRLELPPIADDALLFLWRVSAMVPAAYRVVHAWGFVDKSELVWRKLTKKGKRWFGMGRYVRAEHETCIIAARGRFAVDTAVMPRSVFDAPEDDEPSVFEAVCHGHSKKPDEFYAIAERIGGPDARRLELFARAERTGWTCIGDQVPNNPTRLRVRPA